MQITYDFTPVLRISNALKAAGKQIPLVLTRAVNHTGLKARTQMRRVLVPQTGLKAGTINRAVKSRNSFNGSAFEILARGGNIRLKFFGARETRKGVTAAPWNKRKLYAGTFMKGGRFPNRVGLKMGGAVLKRTGKGRLPLQGQRSGLFIAEDLISGQSEQAFNSTVERELTGRIEHELYRILG